MVSEEDDNLLSENSEIWIELKSFLEQVLMIK